MAPQDNWEALIRDVVARIGRLSATGASGGADSLLKLVAPRSPSQVLTMLEPTQLATYSGPRAPAPWTKIETGYPRADMAWVSIRCRDYGTTTHSASFQVRPDSVGYARTAISFAFPNGNYVDKESTAHLFVELDSQGNFEYSVSGGFQEWDITLHGILESK